MPRYHVHANAIVRVRVANVDADTMEEALEKTSDWGFYSRLFDQRDMNFRAAPNTPMLVTDIEFLEEFESFLVDVDSDEEHSQSVRYDGDGKTPI